MKKKNKIESGFGLPEFFSVTAVAGEVKSTTAAAAIAASNENELCMFQFVCVCRSALASWETVFLHQQQLSISQQLATKSDIKVNTSQV